VFSEINDRIGLDWICPGQGARDDGQPGGSCGFWATLVRQRKLAPNSPISLQPDVVETRRDTSGRRRSAAKCHFT